MSFTEQFFEAAHGAGADLVGIAPIERFDGVVAAHHPSSIFPEAKSVVVLGKRIARGCFRGVEEGTQFGLYAQFGMNWVPDRFLALTTVSVAGFLEDNRWEAVPLPYLPAQVPPMGIAVKEDLPPPNVLLDFNDAAVRAGLGQIGYSGELLTPQFGPRQRLQIILTDAPMDATPLCAEPVCDLCRRCVEVCPLGAMRDGAGDARDIKDIRDTSDVSDADVEDADGTLEICGLRMPQARVDWKRCESCKNGAQPNRYHPSGRPDRLAALCVRTCMHYLEESGRVSGQFQNPFRKRPAWQIDRAGDVSLRAEE